MTKRQTKMIQSKPVWCLGLDFKCPTRYSIVEKDYTKVKPDPSGDCLSSSFLIFILPQRHFNPNSPVIHGSTEQPRNLYLQIIFGVQDL